MKYVVEIEEDEDGSFVAEVPSLPGCVSDGKTREEALANVKEAITGYLERLTAHGNPIPPPLTEHIVIVPAGLNGSETKYSVKIQEDEDGVFVVQVPELPGCISDGKTRNEALTNITEAIQLYLDDLKETGDPVPPPKSETVVEV
jgi:predicted RNase H-like HicB family nuclease